MQYVGTRGYYRDKIQRVYVRARHLDVARGRRTTADLEGARADHYAYSANSPVQSTDPTGLGTRLIGCSVLQARKIYASLLLRRRRLRGE